MLFTYFQPTPDPINFVTPGPIGSADIVIDDSSVYQTVYGFGASLSKRYILFSAHGWLNKPIQPILLLSY